MSDTPQSPPPEARSSDQPAERPAPGGRPLPPPAIKLPPEIAPAGEAAPPGTPESPAAAGEEAPPREKPKLVPPTPPRGPTPTIVPPAEEATGGPTAPVRSELPPAAPPRPVGPTPPPAPPAPPEAAFIPPAPVDMPQFAQATRPAVPQPAGVGVCPRCGGADFGKGGLVTYGTRFRPAYYRPSRFSLRRLHNALFPFRNLVEVEAQVCRACGLVLLQVDTERLEQIERRSGDRA